MGLFITKPGSTWPLLVGWQSVFRWHSRIIASRYQAQQSETKEEKRGSVIKNFVERRRGE